MSHSSSTSAKLPLTAADRTLPLQQARANRTWHADEGRTAGVLHPRVAVLLGVDKIWHLPLLLCRALSVVPAAWWGLRCSLTFLVALLSDEEATADLTWSVERRFRITEVFLAIIWVC